MKPLSDIPERIKKTFTDEQKAAIELLTNGDFKIELYYQETGVFDCIGFVVNGKVTKYADIPRYNAIRILENRVMQELREEITY